MITQGAYNSTPQMVLTPETEGIEESGDVISSSTWSCQISRFSVESRISLHFHINFSLSHCARGLHIAGPLLLLSIRNCIAVASVTIPMLPPRASISRTICPLAMPPTAGLHDICAILFMSIVTRQVCAPMLAAA